MDESILTSIKKILGITETYDSFDTDIIMFINTTFSTLNQIGAGPSEGFFISDETLKWSDYSDNNKLLGFVKQYVYLKVRLVFDPPTLSSVQESYKRISEELEERIKLEVELTADTKNDKDIVTEETEQ